MVQVTQAIRKVNMSGTRIVHPAQYSSTVVDAMVRTLDRENVTGIVLDPFAGPGQSLHRFTAPHRSALGVEMQHEWVDAGNAAMNGQGHGVTLMQGDATRLKLPDNSVAAVCTSPCYGNRFSDHHKAKDGSKRRSYTHDLQTMTGDPERMLKINNAGQYKFATMGYAEIHVGAWREAFRVTKPGGLFLLNVSNFIQRGDEINVCGWHLQVAKSEGWQLRSSRRIRTQRMRHGENHDARVDGERLYLFVKP